MRMTCPACDRPIELQDLLGHDADACGMVSLLVRYAALFSPPGERLSLLLVLTVLRDLSPDIRRHAINGDGRTWRAEPRSWRHALQALVAERDAGRLPLPLPSHTPLYERLRDLAVLTQTAAERQRAADQRPAGSGFRGGGPRHMAEVAACVGTAAPAPPPWLATGEKQS